MTAFLTGIRTGLIVVLGVSSSVAATLEVGPGKRFARIQDAYAAAKAGDTVLVHARPDNAPYEKTAVLVRKERITFRAVPVEGKRCLPVSGKGFDYSGRGATPRAIFQFDPGADGCRLENFELTDAHNETHNGAGVRINQANHIVVRNCHIHHNDMGIMSNGDGTQGAALNQRIEFCAIHHNGSDKRSGFAHNVYLGGTSVTLSACHIYASTNGHNVKSRAHHTRVEYSYIHHSANREFDLVDAADTERPHSHAVLIGNIIVKDPECTGNRAVIHFGQDGGKQHDGTLHLIHNTIVTPFISPVVDLSASKARTNLVGNFVCDDGVGTRNQKLVNVRDGAALANVSGTHNWFSAGFSIPVDSGLDRKLNASGKLTRSPFVDLANHDYRLTKPPNMNLPPIQLTVPAVPGAEQKQHAPLSRQYKHPANSQPRPTETRPTVGAHAAQTSIPN